MNALENTNSIAGTVARDQARKSLRTAANELVGEVFYGTLLRQMRQSPLKGKYGHGGRGEEVFQAQLDTELASRAGKASGASIADAVVDRFERNAEAAAAYRTELRARLAELQQVDTKAPAMGAEGKQ